MTDPNLACMIVTPDGLCYYMNMYFVTQLTLAFFYFWAWILFITLILRAFK